MQHPPMEPSPGQLIVLERLLSGVPVTQAAEAGGVDRTTVHRWLRDDFAFQAAYPKGLRFDGKAIGTPETSLLFSTLQHATGTETRMVSPAGIEPASPA